MTTKKPLTMAAAFDLDKKGCLYAEPCEETGDYGIFGSESGFCYTTFPTKSEAEDWVKAQKAAQKAA